MLRCTGRVTKEVPGRSYAKISFGAPKKCPVNTSRKCSLVTVNASLICLSPRIHTVFAALGISLSYREKPASCRVQDPFSL